jgi:hypothetical protein
MGNVGLEEGPQGITNKYKVAQYTFGSLSFQSKLR